MGVSTQTVQKTTTAFSFVTSDIITNFSVGSIGTEYSHSLTNGLKQVIIRSRIGANIQFSFTSGESGTKYITIPKGSTLHIEGLTFSGKTLYFQTDKVGIVEILELY